jgi:hypothetical protein
MTKIGNPLRLINCFAESSFHISSIFTVSSLNTCGAAASGIKMKKQAKVYL